MEPLKVASSAYESPLESVRLSGLYGHAARPSPKRMNSDLTGEWKEGQRTAGVRIQREGICTPLLLLHFRIAQFWPQRMTRVVHFGKNLVTPSARIPVRWRYR